VPCAPEGATGVKMTAVNDDDLILGHFRTLFEDRLASDDIKT
jgi:hypothetical protein